MEKSSRLRFPLMALGLMALLMAMWAGLFNVVAILLFLANTLLAIRQGASPKLSKMTPQGSA